MATARETAQFILKRLETAGTVAVRPMFGDYALSLDGKVLGLICDNALFLKDTAGARAVLADPETAPPIPAQSRI